MLCCCAIMPIIKAVFMLVLAFFVFLAVSKTELKGLKLFGKILGVILLILAGYMIAMNVCSRMSNGRCPMKYNKDKGNIHMKMHHQQMIQQEVK
ncbi:MAG: hypothetical protein AB1755_00680 [Candidatus Omnitrophota bacterium]